MRTRMRLALNGLMTKGRGLGIERSTIDQKAKSIIKEAILNTEILNEPNEINQPNNPIPSLNQLQKQQQQHQQTENKNQINEEKDQKQQQQNQSQQQDQEKKKLKIKSSKLKDVIQNKQIKKKNKQ
ncbi:unnamed protein product [Paramecium sonneborni]|uniref:Uncharacterized protein n=1 Tax=Paramecium sonneborni TaxID=65129 RepID=A0A8S1NUI4_9CILI|nr:unnamed protein product [Paramecium sonneborni]